LLFQHIEELAARRQASGADRVVVTLQDLGGESGLQSILSDFYGRVLNLIPSIPSRSAARSLCENALISPTGRRLSLEESEIERRFHLSVETLRVLTEQRLLRAEPHADSVYYELSHDSLIEPILAQRQSRRELIAKVGGVLGAVLYVAIVSLSIWKDMRKGR
jgi:hypothetical protein